jgi:hypothetical protein
LTQGFNTRPFPILAPNNFNNRIRIPENGTHPFLKKITFAKYQRVLFRIPAPG